MTATPSDLEHARAQLARDIAQVGPILPGSFVVRHTRCGKPTCRCQAEPSALHGPYILWTRKVAGHTRSQQLSAEQYQRCAPWVRQCPAPAGPPRRPRGPVPARGDPGRGLARGHPENGPITHACSMAPKLSTGFCDSLQGWTIGAKPAKLERMFDLPVEELGAEETLDAVETWNAERLDCEIRTFVAAAHFADLHHHDLPPPRRHVAARVRTGSPPRRRGAPRWCGSSLRPSSVPGSARARTRDGC